jgi:hypothetical protein
MNNLENTEMYHKETHRNSNLQSLNPISVPFTTLCLTNVDLLVRKSPTASVSAQIRNHKHIPCLAKLWLSRNCCKVVQRSYSKYVYVSLMRACY